MLLHRLAEHVPEDYAPPQKLTAEVGKMVSDGRDGGLLRMIGVRRRASHRQSKQCRTFELPLLGSNQDSPDPEGPL